ncbi:MAG: hypothetical protein HRT53_00850 [Colwellia sp.]|nr:hypothetical protein [Colwellia sp.]
MTLFSWFIKANSHATDKQSNKRGVIARSETVKLENGLADELDIFNNNTMWPIAKVKTTSMIIKKPIKKAPISKTAPKIKNTSLVTVPINH